MLFLQVDVEYPHVHISAGDFHCLFSVEEKATDYIKRWVAFDFQGDDGLQSRLADPSNPGDREVTTRTIL